MKGRGRPTKRTKNIENIAINLASEGKTNVQIAKIINIGVSTLNRWISEKTEFRESINKAKLEFDRENVENKLLQRCMGTVVTETKVRKDKEGNVIETVILKKELPPDTTALNLWLKNRHSDVFCEKTRLEIEQYSEIETTHNLTLRDIVNGTSLC